MPSATIATTRKSRKKTGTPANFVPTGYPAIDDIIKPTYGTIPYQETVMQLFASVAGVDFGDADKVRKIVAKKLDRTDARAVKLYKDAEKMWYDGGTAKGIDKATLDEWWEKILANAGYSFNKSHAVAYSTLTYEQLWYRYHYPLEYCAAMIATKPDEFNTWATLLMKEGFLIKPPHVNESQTKPVVSSTKDGILLPLSLVDGLGKKAENRIINNAPYASMQDFSERSGANVSIKCRLYVLGSLDGLDGDFEDLQTGLVYEEKRTAHKFYEVKKSDGTKTEKYAFNKTTMDIDLLSMAMLTQAQATMLSEYVKDGWEIFTIIRTDDEERTSRKGNAFTRVNFYTEKSSNAKPAFFSGDWTLRDMGLSRNSLEKSVVAVKMNQYRYITDLQILR